MKSAADPNLTAALAMLKANPGLAGRVLLLAEPPPAAIESVSEAKRLATAEIGGFDTERLLVIAVNRRMQVIAMEVLTIGTDGFTIVDPKQILRWVLTRKKAAHGFIVAHNHPSGDPTPSEQDNAVTARVCKAATAVGLRLYDHIVVGAGRAHSYAEHGTLPVYSDSTNFFTG